MTRFLDPEFAQRQAAALARLHEENAAGLTDAAAIEVADCEAWMRRLGLRGDFDRVVEDDGSLSWRLEVRTGRGSLVATMWKPEEWKRVVLEWGLLV